MKYFISLLLFCNLLTVSAQEQIHSQGKISAALGYGYNYTYENFGFGQLLYEIPTRTNFSADIGLLANTTNVYAAKTTLRSTFPMKYGSWTLENTVIYRALVRNKLNRFSLGVHGGFKRDYFSARVGFFINFINNMEVADALEQRRPIIEPYNLMYDIEGRLKKNSSRWNLGLRISNFDDFQIERDMSPLFMLTSKYAPNKNNQQFYFWTEISLKPSGTFLLASNFYEFKSRLGICYLFNTKKDNK